MMLDPNDILMEAIKHEREAEKCRSLIAQAEKISTLNKELMSANDKISKLEKVEKDRNGPLVQPESRISKQSKK